MDPRIFNDTFEQEQHICSFCNCPAGNHLVFYRCPLFENNPICQEDCLISMMKDDIDVQMSAKLGNPIDKQTINSICRSCGMNNAGQNNELANKIELERGIIGGNDESEQPTGPKKSR